jgi:transposase-like protein
MVAVRWYLRYALSYRDVEELLAEWVITVDHVTIYRWVPRFTPLLIDAARPCRHVPPRQYLPLGHAAGSYGLDERGVGMSG